MKDRVFSMTLLNSVTSDFALQHVRLVFYSSTMVLIVPQGVGISFIGGDLASGQSHRHCEEAIHEEPKAGESEMDEEKALALVIASIFAAVEDPWIERTRHQ